MAAILLQNARIKTLQLTLSQLCTVNIQSALPHDEVYLVTSPSSGNNLVLLPAKSDWWQWWHKLRSLRGQCLWVCKRLKIECEIAMIGYKVLYIKGRVDP